MTSTGSDPEREADQAAALDRPSVHFHRRVLDRLPTAVIVVDDAGLVVYGNDRLEDIIGWTGEEGLGSGIFEYIHPDDLSWLAEAFIMLADRDNHDPEVVDRPWAPLNFRLIARSGAVVPVEVVGNGSLHDPEVDGIIYEIRPAYERDIVQRVLAGMASGGDLLGQLALVVDLISASLVGIDSAVLRVGDDQTDVLTASNEALRTVLMRAADANELDVFVDAVDEPRFLDVETLTTGFGSDLAALGYLDAWNLDVPSIADDACYRIVGLTEVHHVPAMGVRDRLAQAAEITSVILMRMHNEQLLDRAAHHDALTDLPNWAGLRRLVGEISPGNTGLAILFIDLDGFKAVNDRHGHQYGDQVLQRVARRLTAATGADDIVARLGGDEFAVVLAPSSNAPLDAAAVSKRLIETIEAPLTVDGHTVSVSASLGLVEAANVDDLDTAVGAADRAMYVAKRAGGGQVHSDTS